MTGPADDLTALLAWIGAPAPGHGVRFARADGGWDRWSYPELAQRVRAAAAGLADRGIGPGSVVAVVTHSGPDAVVGMFAAMLAGAAASPMAPPQPMQPRATYTAHLRGLLRSAGPAAVVASPDLVEVVGSSWAGARAVTVAELAGAGAATGALPGIGPEGCCLVQFTSGSTGRPRPVRVTRAALEANIDAIRRWLLWTAADPVCSWLPVHHDMGLTGCLLTPVVNGFDAALMEPAAFLRDPRRYLRCFADGARLSAMPAFGLAHIARKLTPADVADLDLFGVRSIVVGAEHLGPDAFAAVHRLLGPAGLPPTALTPAYGLAEATLAVTGVPSGRRFTTATFDPAALRLGAPVELVDPGSATTTVVGSGTALAHVGLAVAADDGTELPPGTLGEIVVRGPSVRDGGPLRSGDAGFVHEGQLFVVGRLGDAVKVHGRAVFAEDLEAAVTSVATAAGLPVRCAAAVGALPGGAPGVVVAVEGVPVEQRAAAAAAVRHALRGPAAGLVAEVAAVGRGVVPRTTSGKVRRHALWAAYVAGGLAS